MKHFIIDPSSLCSVTTTRHYGPHQGKTNLTAKELIEVIKYANKYSTTSSDDHPDFANLRNELETNGFINTLIEY